MRISFTKLDLFEFCPWAYRYRYVERIPTPFSPRLATGAAVHAVLRRFFERLQSGAQAGLSELVAMYEDYWAGAPWLDPARQPDLWDRGLALLKGFWAANAANPGRPVLLEARFRVSLEPGDRHTVEGLIDRVDETAGGVEIIDYKSGARPDGLPEYTRTQLHTYALAVERQFGLTPVRLTAYFLSDNRALSSAPDRGYASRLRKRFAAAAADIAAGSFGATPGPQCARCDYADRCPHKWTEGA